MNDNILFFQRQEWEHDADAHATNLRELERWAVVNGRFIGETTMMAGTVVPDGWLACDGAAVSRTVYRNLFQVIGTTFGVGDGSTTFNLPDIDPTDAAFDDMTVVIKV